MKFAVPYYKNLNGRWMDAADEIIIKYENNTEEALVGFLQGHEKQRIIIDILNFDEFEGFSNIPLIFKRLKSEYNLKNWALRFNVDTDRISEVEIFLKDQEMNGFDENFERKIDYFYRYAVETFEQLDRLLYTCVSDIYITNSLAFDIVRVREKIETYEFPPYIRIYPNICQSYWNDAKTIHTFFVRPEDVYLYEDYVDIMEIYADTLPQKALANVYLEIYNKDKKWMGDLKEYLINCTESIYNPYIFKDFGKRRLNCKKRCIIDGRCKMCFDQDEYIKLMQKTMGKIENIDVKLAEQNIFIKNGDIGEDLEDIKSYIGESETTE